MHTQGIRSMFRVLGIYNFDLIFNGIDKDQSMLSQWVKIEKLNKKFKENNTLLTFHSGQKLF